tara:strand:+ start:1946 stop:2227 length:282 start_codon:yes stop_codon:yes gene_type:complete
MRIIFDEQRKEEIDLKKLISVYRKLFLNSEEGKIVLNDLADKARICMPSTSGNSSELHYIEGMRGLFCYIASYLEDRAKQELQTQDYDPFNIK